MNDPVAFTRPDCRGSRWLRYLHLAVPESPSHPQLARILDLQAGTSLPSVKTTVRQLLRHCLVLFKTLRGNRSCTKWKNVYYFMLFLEGICLLLICSDFNQSGETPPAWNRHSYGNGFRCNPFNTFTLIENT